MVITEHHKIHRSCWLRAAVLGANDGIVSTASLLLGVAAAGVGVRGVLIAGISGLVAGAMSMAASEYVSVSSQADSERADLDRERKELEDHPEEEREEMTTIYVGRGLDRVLAYQVATQLMAFDALSAHARDELGIFRIMAARPILTGLASAATYSIGAALPLLVVILSPPSLIMWTVSVSSLVLLGLLGAMAASVGGSSMLTAASRITFWGALAMAITAGAGSLLALLV